MFKFIIQLLQSLDQFVEAKTRKIDPDFIVLFCFVSTFLMNFLIFMKVVLNFDVLAKLKSSVCALLKELCRIRSEAF